MGRKRSNGEGSWGTKNIKGIIEDSTFFVYDEAINKMILDFKEYDLKNEALRNLSPKVFQTYLNSLAKHYSRGSILKIWQLIKQCVKYGETQKEIKPNTLVGVKVPLESNVANKRVPAYTETVVISPAHTHCNDCGKDF